MPLYTSYSEETQTLIEEFLENTWNWDEDELVDFIEEHGEEKFKTDFEDCPDYQPDLYYYWDSPLEEDYDWRDALPDTDCLCEICFDILNSEKKIKWVCQ